eukprot:SAG31_NODE_762_length_12275_cov_14.077119_11_plen_83_part_00
MAQATWTASSADNEVSRAPMPIIDLEWETELGWEGGDQLEQWDGGLEFCGMCRLVNVVPSKHVVPFQQLELVQLGVSVTKMS